jgi:acyl-CoA thioesterase FadM
VIVRIAIDYRRELSLEDEDVVVTCWGTGYGTSSIRTAERVIARAGWVAAESESVIVAHDEAQRQARPLTDEEKTTLDRSIAASAATLSSAGSADPT